MTTPDAPRDHAAEAVGPRCVCGRFDCPIHVDTQARTQRDHAAVLREAGWRSPEEHAAVKAERDELSGWIEEHALIKTLARAKAAADERDALRARVAAVEALAEEWDARAAAGTKGIRDALAPGKSPRFPAWIGALRQRAADLRAALTEQAER